MLKEGKESRKREDKNERIENNWSKYGPGPGWSFCPLDRRPFSLKDLINLGKITAIY
jgi:hypothetical protein